MYENSHEIQARMAGLQQALSQTDYHALKAYEGNPTPNWAGLKLLRQAWRDEYNELENKLAQLPVNQDGDDTGVMDLGITTAFDIAESESTRHWWEPQAKSLMKK